MPGDGQSPAQWPVAGGCKAALVTHTRKTLTAAGSHEQVLLNDLLVVCASTGCLVLCSSDEVPEGPDDRQGGEEDSGQVLLKG